MSTPVQVSRTDNAQVIKRRRLLPQSFYKPVTMAHVLGMILNAIPTLFLLLQVLAAGVIQGTPLMVILIFLIFFFIYLSIVVHELGHAFLAKMLGFQIQAMKLGPLHIRFPNEGRWQFTWSSQSPLGFVQACPVSNRNARFSMALFILAGPAMGIITGLICLLVATWIHEPGNSKLAPSAPIFSRYSLFAPLTFPETLFNSAGLVSISLTIIGLIPMQQNGFKSDGAQLWGLLRNGPDTKRQMLLQTLAISMMAGTRPRDWDENIVRDLIASRTKTAEDSQANLYCYYNAIDKGMIAEADQYLGLALAQRKSYPEASRAALFVEGAYFDARFNADVLSARYWLAESRNGVVEEHTRLRAEAAVAYASGKIPEAHGFAQAGIEAIPQSRDFGGRQAEKACLEDLIELCKQRTDGSSAGATPAPT